MCSMSDSFFGIIYHIQTSGDSADFGLWLPDTWAVCWMSSLICISVATTNPVGEGTEENPLLLQKCVDNVILMLQGRLTSSSAIYE